MIERDDDIPALAELLAELELAKAHAAAALADIEPGSHGTIDVLTGSSPGPSLHELQAALHSHVLEPTRSPPACSAGGASVQRERRIAIYADAYRLRAYE